MPEKGSIKLTPEIIKKFEALIGQGVPQKYAAHAIGISEATLYAYLEEAEELVKMDVSPEYEERKRLLVEFSEALKKGHAALIEKNMLLIQVASTQSWQAAAWILERRFPAEFGRFDRIKHEGELGPQVVLFLPDNGRSTSET